MISLYCAAIIVATAWGIYVHRTYRNYKHYPLYVYFLSVGFVGFPMGMLLGMWEITFR